MIILVGICWTFSRSLLCWEAQNWTQYSRSGLIIAEVRVRINFFSMLAISFYCSPEYRYPSFWQESYWLMINSVSTRSPRSFSAELLSSWAFPPCTGIWSYSPPSAGLSTAPCWNSGGSCLSISSACSLNNFFFFPNDSDHHLTNSLQDGLKERTFNLGFHFW